MKACRLLRLFAALLALALLAATLAWRIPFMLWDHLDFAPIYASWQSGAPLSQTIFWHNHGGHLHAAAYAVLLFTTWFSHGQTWLDCFVSWIFLVAYAATIHHGIPVHDFPFDPEGSDDLLFFGRIHPDKGAGEAIRAARATGHRLILCGLV